MNYPQDKRGKPLSLKENLNLQTIYTYVDNSLINMWVAIFIKK